MLNVSVVTLNRRPVLEQVVDRILSTTEGEDVRLYISDNGSTDDTPDYLRELRASKDGVRVWLLPENVGIAKARNAHWSACLGEDILRLDDKILIESASWINTMRELSYRLKAQILLSCPESSDNLWELAGSHEYHKFRKLLYGAGTFIPKDCALKLGAWCEDYGNYGHEDCDWLDRGVCEGWAHYYTLRVYNQFLSRAGRDSTNHAMQYANVYWEHRLGYLGGTRSTYIPIKYTQGHRLRKHEI